METIVTRVLVIGGGAAGHAAALAAVDCGVEVLQLYKGPATTAISTGFLTFPVAARFGPEQLRQVLLEVTGKGLCDRRLLDRFISCAESEITAAIKRYAIDVDEVPRGLRARRVAGARGRDLVDESTAVAGVNDMSSVVMEFSATHGTSLFSAALKAVKASAVRRLKGTAVRIHGEGPVVIALVDGRLIRIHAASVIIASGGVQGLYEFTDSPAGILGSGLAMALEAGARAVDMEFIQFYPLALAEPGTPAIFIYPDFPPGAKILNSSGENLLEKHFNGEQSLGSFDNWDHLSVVLQQEILAGQQVSVDFTATDPGAWDSNSLTKLFLDRYAGNYLERPITVSPIAHYTIGGIAVNSNGETTLPGIFAVGEAAGGMHGANRHGGISLAEGITFGAIAGREAATRMFNPAALKTSDPGQTATPPAPPLPLDERLSALRRLCQKKLGPLRRREDLESLGADLVQRRAEAARAGWRDSNGFCALESYRQALLVAQVMCRFMLNRTESRGVHFRMDYPQTDPAWLKKQQLHIGDNGELELEDVAV